MDTTTPAHDTGDCTVKKEKKARYQENSKKQSAYLTHAIPPKTDDDFMIDCPTDEECETYRYDSGTTDFNTSSEEEMDSHDGYNSYFEEDDPAFCDQYPLQG